MLPPPYESDVHLRFPSENLHSAIFNLKSAWSLALFLAIGLPTGWFLSSVSPAVLTADGDIVGPRGIVLLEPEKWQGRPCPLLKHIDVGEQLAAGEWLVVLYHHDCPKCQELLPGYEAAAREGAPRIALIEVPPFVVPPLGGGQADEPPEGGTTNPLRGKLTDSRPWFVATPATLSLKDGVVIATRTADRADHRDLNNQQPELAYGK